MRQFQILNKDKQPISLNELDKEASEFFKVEPHPKYYAEGWFDSLGWCIARKKCQSWREVEASLVDLYDSNLDLDEYLTGSIIPLIKHWEAKDYTPNGF